MLTKTTHVFKTASFGQIGTKKLKSSASWSFIFSASENEIVLESKSNRQKPQTRVLKEKAPDILGDWVDDKFVKFSNFSAEMIAALGYLFQP